MPAVLAYALQLLGSLPMLIEAGANVVELVKHGEEKISAMVKEKRNPTQAERDELKARIQALRDELHQP